MGAAEGQVVSVESGRSEVVLPSYERALERTKHLADLVDPVRVQARLEARIAAMEVKLADIVSPMATLGHLLQDLLTKRSTKKRSKSKERVTAK